VAVTVVPCPAAERIWAVRLLAEVTATIRQVIRL
jgi:hypothetical protein